MEEQAQLHFPVCLSPSSAPTSQPRAIYKRLVTSKKQKSSPLSQAQPYHATRPSLITRPERHLGETHRKTKEQAQLHFPESVSQFRPYLPSNGPVPKKGLVIPDPTLPRNRSHSTRTASGTNTRGGEGDKLGLHLPDVFKSQFRPSLPSNEPFLKR